VSVIRSSSPTVASGRSRRLGRRRSDGPGAATAAALNAQQTLRGASRDGVLRAAGERYSGLTLLLVAVDVASASLVSNFLLDLPFWWEFAVAIFMITCRTTARVYRRRLRLSYFDDLPRALSAVLAAFGGIIAVVMLLGENSNTSVSLLYAAGGFVAVSEPLRALVFQVTRSARRHFRRGDRTLIAGTDPVAIDLMRNMLEHPEFGLRPVGFVDAEPQVPEGSLPAPLLGHDLAAAIDRHRIGTVVLAHLTIGESQTVEDTMTAHQKGCSILIVPRMHELYRDGTDVERLRSYPLVRLLSEPTRRPSWLAKRALDVAFGVLAGLLAAPVMIVCALAVLLESGRPILFAQERVGVCERRFQIYKFRSMKPASETEAQTTWTIAGDPRIGPVGRFLRASSLDELPQLWNVICGDMSLVGPRPERPGFVERFSLDHERYSARHRVPPGLTGLAQVNGLRGNTSIADRARYDNYYIANWSLWLDLKIVLLTTRELLRRGDY
jgi:exopolysaccharide biosynthesis polyprenyl glycosylphosphotransferase